MSADAILHSMEQLQALHTSLLALSVTKTESIKNGDMDSLDALLKDEQTHVAAISQVERQRAAATEHILRAHGYTGREVTAETVAAYLSPEQSEALLGLRSGLLQTISELKQRNELNQKLTYQSLQYVNLSLDLLLPKEEKVNYTKNDATGSKQVPTRSYFDSQA